MAKSKIKAQISKGQAAAKASAATKAKGSADSSAKSKSKTAAPPATQLRADSSKPPGRKSPQAPVSSDIRRGYMKSLLGDYLGKHRGEPAIKPKK